MFLPKSCAVFLLFLFSLGWAHAWQGESLPKDPQRALKPFLENLKKIQPGMSTREVETLLGKPDAIVKRKDRPRSSGELLDESKNSEPAIVWIYGNEDPLLTPSLGSVSFGIDNKAIGHKRSKLSETAKRIQRQKELESIGDEKAKSIIENLHSTKNRIVYQQEYIKIINTLHKLGKENALAILELFNEIPSEKFSTYVHYSFPRLLFEVPEDTGYFPRMPYDCIKIDYNDLNKIPGSPFVLIDDVPLRMSSFASGSSGPPPSFSNYILYYREKGVFRKLPLCPKGNPMDLMKQFETTAGFLFPEKGPFFLSMYKPTIAYQRMVIVEQIESFIKPVYIIPKKYKPLLFNNTTKDHFYKHWELISQDFSKVQYKWDEDKSSLTFLDGSTLPP